MVTLRPELVIYAGAGGDFEAGTAMGVYHAGVVGARGT